MIVIHHPSHASASYFSTPTRSRPCVLSLRRWFHFPLLALALYAHVFADPTRPERSLGVADDGVQQRGRDVPRRVVRGCGWRPGGHGVFCTSGMWGVGARWWFQRVRKTLYTSAQRLPEQQWMEKRRTSLVPASRTEATARGPYPLLTRLLLVDSLPPANEVSPPRKPEGKERRTVFPR